MFRYTNKARVPGFGVVAARAHRDRSARVCVVIPNLHSPCDSVNSLDFELLSYGCAIVKGDNL